jgi:hypothetical protein
MPGADNHCAAENMPFGVPIGYRLEAMPDWRQILLNLKNMGLDGWSAYGPNLEGNSPDTWIVATPAGTSNTKEEGEAANTLPAKTSSSMPGPTGMAIGERIVAILNGE